MANEFLTDIQTLRNRSRSTSKRERCGGHTAPWRRWSDPEEALATEMCAFCATSGTILATGSTPRPCAEFLEHANEEQGHADMIAERITQLGGAPNFDPDGLTSRSHAEYIEGDSLVDMIKEDLVAERIAIDSYREMAQYFGVKDTTSRGMIERILAMEEKHADDLVNLLTTLDPTEKP